MAVASVMLIHLDTPKNHARYSNVKVCDASVSVHEHKLIVQSGYIRVTISLYFYGQSFFFQVHLFQTDTKGIPFLLTSTFLIAQWTFTTH